MIAGIDRLHLGNDLRMVAPRSEPFRTSLVGAAGTVSYRDSSGTVYLGAGVEPPQRQSAISGGSSPCSHP